MQPLLIRALLQNPACYDHPVGKLELVETHISWVLLTGYYAYKIKKPVNPGFLDFSTLVLRQQDCLEELRLNKRLAAQYYLDVVAISGTPDFPRVNGSGEVLEYAVKMRQFLADATLDKLAERGELGSVQVDALAARLAHFHLFECERAQAGSPWGEPAEVVLPVEENFKLLASRLDDAAEIKCLYELQNLCRAEQARLMPLMGERKRAGFVRECHGDLHLANLAWAEGQLVIFDCLEFNPALRWIDVMSEVAFCFMDLLYRNHADLAFRFLNAWLEITGDYQGVALLRYYAVYRALVRAKVASLRAGQGCQASRAEVTGCLKLARQLAEPPSEPSPADVAVGLKAGDTLLLAITHGLSGSGKTTQSQILLEKHGMIRLRSDIERKRLAGLDPSSREGEALGLYSRSFGVRTYRHLAELADSLLHSGWSVIVDAAFLQRWERDLFRELAGRHAVSFRIFHVQADLDVLQERIRRRQAAGIDASDAGLQVLERQRAIARPLDADEIEFTERVNG